MFINADNADDDDDDAEDHRDYCSVVAICQPLLLGAIVLIGMKYEL